MNRSTEPLALRARCLIDEGAAGTPTCATATLNAALEKFDVAHVGGWQFVAMGDKYEDKIFDYLDEYADELGNKSGMQMVIDYVTRDDDYYTMQTIKEKAVWMYVELNAVDLLIRNEHPDWV